MVVSLRAMVSSASPQCVHGRTRQTRVRKARPHRRKVREGSRTRKGSRPKAKVGQARVACVDSPSHRRTRARAHTHTHTRACAPATTTDANDNATALQLPLIHTLTPCTHSSRNTGCIHARATALGHHSQPVKPPTALGCHSQPLCTPRPSCEGSMARLRLAP